MDNTPVVSITGQSPAPGVDREIWDRYEKWRDEVYTPLHLTIPGLTEIYQYRIINEQPEYPAIIHIRHLPNIRLYEESYQNPERTAVAGEQEAWIKRRVMTYFWSVRYLLIKGLGAGRPGLPATERAGIEQAPVLHLEGYRLPTVEREKYAGWLNDYGFNSFIPLFMRLPGLNGYCCYQNASVKGIVSVREWEYPDFLSALFFKDKAAFENYANSSEVLAFQKAILNVFPNGLNLRWYVQYQLVKSWRK